MPLQQHKILAPTVGGFEPGARPLAESIIKRERAIQGFTMERTLGIAGKFAGLTSAINFFCPEGDLTTYLMAHACTVVKEDRTK